jgi:hypothetical protein
MAIMIMLKKRKRNESASVVSVRAGRPGSGDGGRCTEDELLGGR